MPVVILLILFFFSPETKADTAVRFENNEKVFLLGNESVVAAEEVLPEVVFVGRRLEVYGKIKKLHVVAGEAVVFSGGKIFQLVLLEGKFHTEGGEVPPPQEIEYRNLGYWWSLLLNHIGLVNKVWRQFFFWTFAILSTFFLWGFGLFLSFLAPRFAQRFYREFFPKLGENFLFSALIVLVSPALWVLLAISIVGVLLIPILFLLYLLCAFLSYLYLGYWLGHRLYPSKEISEVRPKALFLGFAILQVLWVSGIHYSWMLIFLLWFFSYGQLMRMWFRRAS